MKFRRLTDDSLDAAKYAARDKISPFIVGSEYAQTLTEKRELLKRTEIGSTVLFPWGGRYSTDVLELSLDEAQELVA